MLEGRFPGRPLLLLAFNGDALQRRPTLTALPVLVTTTSWLHNFLSTHAGLDLCLRARSCIILPLLHMSGLYGTEVPPRTKHNCGKVYSYLPGTLLFCTPGNDA